MNNWRIYILHYRTSSWLLVAVLLMQTVFPVHFHLHHSDNTSPQEHAHVVDSHLLTDSQASEHHADEDTHPLKTSPDAIAKQNMDTGFVATLAVSLIVLFSIFLPALTHNWRRTQNLVNHSRYYKLAPPLRAPPSI